jgi:hypothetical protein
MTMHGYEAMEPGSGETFLLEYRVNSTQGGVLSFGIKGDHDAYTLIIDITSPKTHLQASQIGKAAAGPAAYDTVAGTVWFHIMQDEFRYFTDHAYGKGATSKQNFADFHLLPFDWLRLTVEPHLDEQFVNVGFEVVDVLGKRVPFANAPASLPAGATFQAVVDRNMTAMLAQEAQKAGSSTPWTSPFYYDSPGVGGVVQVVAQGAAGVFQIAYAVESPQHDLKDVPFVAYEPVTITGSPDTASCDKSGDPGVMASLKGVFDMSFTASSAIMSSPNLKGPLVGTIYCSIFNAADVTISGPIDGAMSLQDFQIDNADLSNAVTMPVTFESQEFSAGNYQILCYQDLDNTMSPTKGDPVTIPTGSYPIACNKNSVDVEFAVLDPSDQ